MSFLELDRVAKQFGPQTVVDDFSLTVGKGEFVSFLGPSGCGKTTTLQMIAGSLDPSRGAIRLEGRDLTAVQPAKRGLGIVFQSYALFPHMTAAENVAFGLEMRRVPRAECRERVRTALAMVGLAGHEERYPRRLSGGSWSAPAPVGLAGPVTVSIRPERIGFGDAGLAAKIVTRIFQGNHWLFQCESECGTVSVIRQNDGQPQPAEGEAVRLAWRVEDMSLRGAGGAV